MPATAERDLLSLFPPGRFEFVPQEPMSEDEFFDLCQRADPLRLERDANGTVIVMPPAGYYSSNRSLRIAKQLQDWADENEGAVSESSGGFTLPNGATRAPDAAWVSSDRLANLSAETKEKFLPLAPDFAVEVRSQNDRREDLEAKMAEYVANGTQLGWLVDPYDETVTVYRRDGTVETHESPETLSADPVCPGFTCDLERVWNPSY